MWGVEAIVSISIDVSEHLHEEKKVCKCWNANESANWLQRGAVEVQWDGVPLTTWLLISKATFHKSIKKMPRMD